MSTCRASRTRLRRHRRRRWIARRSAFKFQPPPPRTISQPIERNGIELRPDATGIQLSTIEYHAGPAHLTPEDLALCGLTPTGKKPWPESIAARWHTLSYDTKPTHLSDSDLATLALAWR